jgi:YspA, cpYpsA-related SLOG family
VRDGLYQVTRGSACAGFVVHNGRITDCAPILRARGYAGWIRRVDTFHRLLVTGSRRWEDADLIRRSLLAVLGKWGCRPDQLVVVQGKAAGADRIARSIAMELGMRYEDHPVTNGDWRRYGNSAGHRRNAVMVAAGARGCVAFPLGESRGTRGCMAMCERAGIPVWDRGYQYPAVA